MIEAVEAVRHRMLKAASALREAKIPYAVIGGNAVAAWVSRVDRAAVRNTQDVDVLVRRSDFAGVQTALENAGFVYRNILNVDCFLDTIDSHPRDAVHIVFAGEKVKPNDLEPTADVTEREIGEGYEVIQLESLVRMKLTSFRIKDRMHLLDLISVALIDPTWPSRFQPELGERLQELLNNPDG